jgi:hypothetical protein
VRIWKSGPSVASAAAAVSSFSTLAVRAGVVPARSNSTSPVSARTTYPESAMRRGSEACPAIEHVRSRLATRSPSGTSRVGSGVGVALGSTAAAEPTLTPAKTAPVPRRANTSARAPVSHAVGCFAKSAPMPRGAGPPTSIASSSCARFGREPRLAAGAAASRAARREIGCSSVTQQ